MHIEARGKYNWREAEIEKCDIAELNQIHEFFIGVIIDFVIVVVSIIMLWKGADWLVDSAAEIAHTFKISDLIIGLTVVAFGTSAPEFAVTISAAATSQTDISIGNVIGSNIFNLGFILGGTAMIRPISTSQKMFERDGLFLLVTTALIFFLFFVTHYTTLFVCYL